MDLFWTPEAIADRAGIYDYIEADKPAAACVYLWTRNHSLCPGPKMAGRGFDPSLTEGQLILPAGQFAHQGREIDTAARIGVERFVPVGWSYLGLMVMLYAAEHPERVERVVLIDAVPFLPGYRWHFFARQWRRRRCAAGEIAARRVRQERTTPLHPRPCTPSCRTAREYQPS